MFRTYFFALSCLAVSTHGMSLSQIRSEADQGGVNFVEGDVKAKTKAINDKANGTNEPRVPAKNSGAKVDAKAKADDKAKSKKEDRENYTFEIPIKFKRKQ